MISVVITSPARVSSRNVRSISPRCGAQLRRRIGISPNSQSAARLLDKFADGGLQRGRS
jgi:hypothetical protein